MAWMTLSDLINPASQHDGVSHYGPGRACRMLLVLLVLGFFAAPVALDQLRRHKLPDPNSPSLQAEPVNGDEVDKTGMNDSLVSPKAEQHADPSLRSLCYVHVGKSGGNSVVKAIKSLLSLGSLDSAVQIHGLARHGAERDRDYGPVLGSKGRNPGGYANATSFVRTYRNYGGPLSNLTIEGVDSCMDTGQVLLWVRDPVSRLISAWNNNENYLNAVQAAHDIGAIRRRNDTNELDLNDLVEYLSDLENRCGGNGVGFEALYEVLGHVQHATMDVAFYLGDKGWYPSSWSDRSTTCLPVLSTLHVLFVGRTEYMPSDWEAFLDKMLGKACRQKRVALPHTHASKRQGKTLSQKSVAFLRRFYSTDYDCISYMVEQGWLKSDYYKQIRELDKLYQY